MIKLLNKLEKLELDKKKISSIILVCLILIYMDLSFLMRRQIQGIKILGSNIIKLKKDTDALTRELAEIEDLKRKQTGIEPVGFLKNKKILSEEQMPSFLGYLSETANKNNIKITQIKPIKEQKASKDVSKFTPLVVALDLFCGYHHLGSFINDLENAESFIAVQEMSITPNPKDYFHQEVRLMLKTYVEK